MSERPIILETDNAFGIDFEVESYLEGRHRFTEPSMLIVICISRAMDLFDAGDHGGTIEKVLLTYKLDSALIIGVKSDLLFPIDQQEELSVTIKSYIPDTKLKSLDSLQGHDFSRRHGQISANHSKILRKLRN